MALPKYEDLTDFQKWSFFYISKEGFMPIDLEGVMPKMCLTVKMKIDVDNYDEEKNKLLQQLTVLNEQGLFNVSNRHASQGEYILTDKGELYILQKILKPLLEIKDKNKLNEIADYFNHKDDDVKNRIEKLLTNTQTENPQKTIANISELVLSRAMPYLGAINLLHEFAEKTGLT